MKSLLVLGILLIGRFAFSANTESKIYVANEEAGTISVVDLNLNSVVRTIETMKGQGPNMTMFMAHNVQVAPNKKTVWVTAVAMNEGGHAVWGGGHASAKSDEVIVFDSKNDQLLKRIPLGSDLHLAHVVLDENSRFAFVTSTGSDQIFQIDANSFQVVRKIKLSKGAGPHGARICGNYLFAAGMNGKSLIIFDTLNGGLKEVAVGGVAVQTACLKDGSAAFATLYDTKEVIRYDLKSGQILRSILPSESKGPAQLTISADNSKLLVADQGLLMDRPSSNIVYVMDPSSLAIQSSIRVGDGAHGIAIGNSGKFAYITSQVDSKVTMVDLDSNTVVRDILVGEKPNGISILE